MTPEIRHVPEKQRYEIIIDGDIAGFADYDRQNGHVRFLHTEVDEAYAGRGLAKQLVTTMLDDVAERELQAVPVCPYVKKVIRDDADAYLELVPEEARDELAAGSS